MNTQLLGAFGVVLALVGTVGVGAHAQNPRPAFSTAPVPGAPGDPAIWVNRRAPAQSLLLGTSNGPTDGGGGLYVFNLQGQRKQTIKLDHPSGVDVEYGVRLGGKPIDIAVVTEQGTKQLRIYRILGSGELVDIAPLGIGVFEGESDAAREPSGVALYKRVRDGATFAFVTRKNSPTLNPLWQYRLLGDGKGNAYLQRIRTLGAFSGLKSIGPVSVDDSAGVVYYADRGFGVRKYYADPARPHSDKEAGLFARNFRGSQEGIAIYAPGRTGGAVVCTEQVAGNARFHLFRRDTARRARPEIATLSATGPAPGIAITPLSLGARFNRGILVTANLDRKTYTVYDARALAARK